MIAPRAGWGLRATALALLAASPAEAGPLADLAGAPPGAAACSGCHAPAAAAGQGVPVIHGRPAAEIVGALAAFRAHERPATVMDRIASGFSPAESEAIADWIGARR